jgi:CBS domain containing-hemolysin-like protein
VTTAALIAVVVMLLLNAFFVLAEFAMVKLRPTQVEALDQQGNPRALLVAHIQAHLDEYLSVCQLGITLASIGLGFTASLRSGLLEPILGSWVGRIGPRSRSRTDSLVPALLAASRSRSRSGCRRAGAGIARSFALTRFLPGCRSWC